MKYFFRSLLLFLVMISCINPSIAQWIQIHGSYKGNINCFALSSNGADSTNLFAGTDEGVFLSTDNDTCWTPVSSGLTIFYVIRALAVLDTNLFAGTNGGVFLSTNNGTNWTPAGLTYTWINALTVSGTNLFAGTDSGVFVSTNNGISWTAVKTGMTSFNVRSFAVSDTNLFVSTWGGVFLSTNNGANWTPVNSGLTNSYVYTLAVSGTYLFAGTSDGVFLSTNNGTSWTQVNSGLPRSTSINTLAVSDTKIFAGTYSSGVFLSTDNGSSWTTANTGLTSLNVSTFAISSTNLLAGTFGGGVWRRPLSEMVPIPVGQGWTIQNSGVSISLFSVKAVNQNIAWTAGDSGIVLKTTNGGSTWNSVGGGAIGSNTVNAIDALDVNNAFVTTTSSSGPTYIYRTTNGGTTWQQVFSQSDGFIDAIKMYDANNGIALGDPVDGKWTILSTIDGSATWRHIATEPAPGGMEYGITNSLATFGTTNIWFGTSLDRIYHSNNGGITWSSVLFPKPWEGAPYPQITGITFCDMQHGLAGSSFGDIVRTIDSGNTWLSIPEPGVSVTSGTTKISYTIYGLAAAGNDCFCIVGNNIYRSVDQGIWWCISQTNTSRLNHLSFVANESVLSGWVVGEYGKIIAFTKTITGVKNGRTSAPAEFVLYQNYPNPFNPSTVIRYQIEKLVKVSLKVYDLLGREVATLVNEVKAPGSYTATFNAANISSGVYFYRLQTGSFIATKKLVLLR